MAIKPDFHILARDCGNGKLDWKNHIHTSEKAASDFRDKLDGEWKIFKLEPVEVIEEFKEKGGVALMTTFDGIKDVIVEEVRKNEGDLIYVKVQDHSMKITIHAGLLVTTWSISKSEVKSVSSCFEEFNLEELSNDLVRMKNYSWVLSVMQRMLLKASFYKERKDGL